MDVIRMSHEFSFKIVRVITIVFPNSVFYCECHPMSSKHCQRIRDDVMICRHLAVESTYPCFGYRSPVVFNNFMATSLLLCLFSTNLHPTFVSIFVPKNFLSSYRCLGNYRKCDGIFWEEGLQKTSTPFYLLCYYFYLILHVYSMINHRWHTCTGVKLWSWIFIVIINLRRRSCFFFGTRYSL